MFVDGGEITANMFRMTGAGGDLISHNTIVNAPITFGTSNCATRASRVTIIDNVIPAGIATLYGASHSGTVDYNFSADPAVRGAHGVGGSPAFAGGASPDSWAGFELTAESSGYHSASDGSSMGIVP